MLQRSGKIEDCSVNAHNFRSPSFLFAACFESLFLFICSLLLSEFRMSLVCYSEAERKEKGAVSSIMCVLQRSGKEGGG